MAKKSAAEVRKDNLKKQMQKTQERATKAGAGGGGMFESDGSDDLKFFQSKAGEDHILDIVPYIAGENSPIDDLGDRKNPKGDYAYVLEFWRHGKLGPEGKKNAICLAKNFGKKCAVCEHRKELIDSGGDEDLIKDLKPSLRDLYNVIVYSTPEEEAKGIQLWSVAHYYAETQFQKLAKKIQRRGSQAGDPYTYYYLPDKEGRSIVYTQEGADNMYKLTGVRFEERNYELEDEILEKAHVLEDILRIPTSEEIHALYWGEESDDDDEQTTKETPAEETTNRKPKRSGVPKVEEKKEQEPEELALDDCKNKDQLLVFIEQEGIEIELADKMSYKRLMASVAELVDTGSEDDSSVTDETDERCEYGGQFGVTIDEVPDDKCDDCDIWSDCAQEHEKLAK